MSEKKEIRNYRNPYEVALQIKKEIPNKYYEALEECLNNPFRAPEIVFELLSIFVNNIISYPPNEEWEWKVVSILTTKSIEQLHREAET